MPTFAGFLAGKVRFTKIPAPFFAELLPQIDHLGELKVTLYVLWFLEHQEGNIRYITLKDFINDPIFMKGLEEPTTRYLTESLERAVKRGTLLVVKPPNSESLEDALFFLNSPRGRAAVEAVERGDWTPDKITRVPAGLDQERPNIYRLYEENIGNLTPLIAEDLREAEQIYPMDWIEEAFHQAVQSNVRKWRYIEKILRSWQEEGHHDANRSNPTEDRRRFIKGELSDYIQH